MERERDQLRKDLEFAKVRWSRSMDDTEALLGLVDRYRAALEKVRRQALHGVSLTACEACRANEITVYHALSADSTEAPQEEER